jgi:hypothetical protein
MRRITISSLAVALCLGLGMLVPAAQADDAGLQKALKAYESRLTTDIGYLAAFTKPSAGGVPTALHRLSKIAEDLSGATHAAKTHHASTTAGAKGRTEVLAALHDAMAATRDAEASAKAVRGGKPAKAKHEAKLERSAINKAIPLFESGGKKLHLF